MSNCKSFTRSFILAQMRAFGKNLEHARAELKSSPITAKYALGKVLYNRHAMAACKFMLAQLQYYKQPPFYPSDKKDGGK